MSLNLRPLFVLLLPLMSEFLSLLLWSRLIALDAPGSLPFPMSIIIPPLPVLSTSLVRNPFKVPSVTVPIMFSVVSSPPRVHIIIKTWNAVIINPTPVIIMRAIPTPFPWTPPPAIPEKNVCFYIRNSVHIARIRQHYHLRRCRKYDGWWQRNSNSNTYIYPCHCWNRNDYCQRQKNCPQK